MTIEQDKANLAIEMMRAGWKNRRKMAWISFIYAIGFPAIIAVSWLISPDLSDKIIAIAVPIYTLIGVVMAAYFGLATWDSIETKKKVM